VADKKESTTVSDSQEHQTPLYPWHQAAFGQALMMENEYFIHHYRSVA
jgi:hypothetical protein